MKTVTLESTISGERLDVFLASNIPDLSRSAAQKLLASGGVTLQGKVLAKNHKTSLGEVYSAELEEAEEPVALPEDIPLNIVLEDDDLIVINKPQGMVVHPAPGHFSGTLVNALLFHCGDSLSGIGGVKRPGIVHRLDKDTSGLIIAAKNDRAHLALANQLSSRTLTREYEAVVRGVLKSDSGKIDAPIGRHPTDRKRQAVARLQAREAVTYYEVVTRFYGVPGGFGGSGSSGYTHVRCRLETGRTHQIRVHMAHVGHPVVGDFVYGMKKPELGMSVQCLHAARLKFEHPSSGESVELCAELPEYFLGVLGKLKGLEG